MSSSSRNDRELDKFYTHPEVAKSCYEAFSDIVRGEAITLFVEPAAGAGVFLDLLPAPKIGLDIAPGRHDIQCCDFLTWKPSSIETVAVVTNVPFGKNASLAVKFVNHAAGFSRFVASILPRTFKKASIQNRLDPRLHLRLELSLPPNAFVFQGNPYDVPAVFHVYETRMYGSSRIIAPSTHPDFSFVRDAASADFAFQRVGARAGLVSKEGLRKSPNSHYFIKAHSDDVERVLAGISWEQVKSCTAGNPSISKVELVEAYTNATSSISNRPSEAET